MSLPAPMFSTDDGPRAGLLSPLASHVGADKSSVTRIPVGKAVIQMLTSPFDKADGTLLNTYYFENWKRLGWDKAAWDSPRKRAGELAARRELAIVNPGSEDPAEYCLPEKLGWLTGVEPRPFDFDTVQERNDAGDI